MIATLLRPRVLYAGVLIACAGLIGFAMYLQEAKNLEPCPLCILQRYLYVLVGALALVAALLPRLLGRWVAGLGTLAALGGVGIGIWHVWLQMHPPKFASCGASLGYLVENLPLARALPRIFQGYSECSAIDWTFLGLTIPAWSAICFALIAATFVLAQSRR
jgi:protein dithiol:quinone oxidoreductase